MVRNPSGTGSNFVFSGRVGGDRATAVSFDLSAAGFFGGQAEEK